MMSFHSRPDRRKTCIGISLNINAFAAGDNQKMVWKLNDISILNTYSILRFDDREIYLFYILRLTSSMAYIHSNRIFTIFFSERYLRLTMAAVTYDAKWKW